MYTCSKDCVHGTWGPHKYCKILLDEVQIKPSIRYYGNHIIWFAADADKPADKTNNDFGVSMPYVRSSSIVARLIPIYSISAELINTEEIFTCQESK